MHYSQFSQKMLQICDYVACKVLIAYFCHHLYLAFLVAVIGIQPQNVRCYVLNNWVVDYCYSKICLFVIMCACCKVTIISFLWAETLIEVLGFRWEMRKGEEDSMVHSLEGFLLDTITLLVQKRVRLALIRYIDAHGWYLLTGAKISETNDINYRLDPTNIYIIKEK